MIVLCERLVAAKRSLLRIKSHVPRAGNPDEVPVVEAVGE